MDLEIGKIYFEPAFYAQPYLVLNKLGNTYRIYWMDDGTFSTFYKDDFDGDLLYEEADEKLESLL